MQVHGHRYAKGTESLGHNACPLTLHNQLFALRQGHPTMGIAKPCEDGLEDIDAFADTLEKGVRGLEKDFPALHEVGKQFEKLILG